MNSNIYPLFQRIIDNYKREIDFYGIDEKETRYSEKIFRVIISFENISIRDEFISKQNNIEILNKFDLIPSILTILILKEIQDFQENELVMYIEEDQELFLSLLETREIIKLNHYKKATISLTGININIGIIDNGINETVESISNVTLEHYHLKKNMQDDKEDLKFEEFSHGTLMASLIFNQYLDNENNKIGIAPGAKIVDFNIINSTQKFYITNVLEIFDLIKKDNIIIDILLIALTSKNPSDGQDILSRACNILVDEGVIIINPSGNNGPEKYTIGTPSAAAKVMTIGAISKKRRIARFSGRGPTLDGRIKPDFCLPGSEIFVPVSKKKIINLSGTCVAASICVGIVALIKEFNPKFTPLEIHKTLQEASFGLGKNSISQGHGTFDFSQIIKILFSIDENALPYSYLIKKSLLFSIEFTLFLVILYFLPFIINYMMLL